MGASVDLYNTSYGNYGTDVYRDVRIATYGEDFGQTSWVTTEESHEIPPLLNLTETSVVIEIGSGSGRYALHLAETIRCRVIGLDVNAEGVRNANALAAERQLTSCAEFRQADVSEPLPFAAASIDAVFSNDAFCHVPARLALLHECARVLKPAGRLLFSDALIVGGILSNDEVAIRTSIGRYFLVPPSENERLIDAAGLRLIEARDTTEAAAALALRWYDARNARRDALIAVEGQTNFDGLQKFLISVHTLTREKRLRRAVYLARK